MVRRGWNDRRGERRILLQKQRLCCLASCMRLARQIVRFVFTLITVCTVIFSTWYTLSKSISRHKLMILTYRNNTFGHLFMARPRAPTPLLPPLLPPSTILLSLSRSFSSSLHNQVPHARQPIQRHVSDRLRRRFGRRHPLLHEKQGVRHYRHQVPCLEP